jgi:hypothetical protein
MLTAIYSKADSIIKHADTHNIDIPNSNYNFQMFAVRSLSLAAMLVLTLSIDFTVKVKGHSTQCFYEHLSNESLIQHIKPNSMSKFHPSRQDEPSSLLHLWTTKTTTKTSQSIGDSWVTAKQ